MFDFLVFSNEFAVSYSHYSYLYCQAGFPHLCLVARWVIMTSRVTRPSLKSMMHEAYSISAKFPYFRKISKFPLFSFKLCSFGFINFFASSYLDHEALIHHALHVLDASAYYP